MGSPTSARFPPSSHSEANTASSAAAVERRYPSQTRPGRLPYTPSVRAGGLSPENRLLEIEVPRYRRLSVNHAAEPYYIEGRPIPGASYPRAPYPVSPRETEHRGGGVGPQRTRGRANTQSLPRADHGRPRDASFALPIAGHSPPYTAVPLDRAYSPRSWDDRRSRRDSFAARAEDALHPSRHSPPSLPATSPLLFAPLTSAQDAHAVRRSSGLPAITRSDRAVLLRSRPGTPISPINIDGLSMDDPALKSHSQYSPPDARYLAVRQNESGRSPPMHEYRHDQREYVHHAPVMPSAGSTPRDHVRYMPSSFNARNIPSHSSPALAAEQLEREHFAQAGPRHMPYPPANANPAEYGFQSEHVHHSRMRTGSIASLDGQQNAPADRIAHSRRRRRPPYSYASMITQAISSSAEGRMTLREIYTWISSNFNGYPMAGPDSQGWQNTVRHNLSLGKIFIKKQRTAQDIYDSCSSGNPSQSQAARGKGGWWTLHPVVLEQIRSGQRTHNDEFDDVERLMEMDAASAKAEISAAAPDMTKTLSRQRSYSDTLGASTVGFSRAVPTGPQTSTAPVSRKPSVRVNDGSAKDASTSGMHTTPSVLQPTASLYADREDAARLQGRLRDFTMSHSDDIPLRRATHDDRMHQLGFGDAPHTAPTPTIPLPQDHQDVDMDTSPRHSKRILRDAREDLVCNRLPKVKQTSDSEDNSGRRMDIRGLLNNNH